LTGRDQAWPENAVTLSVSVSKSLLNYLGTKKRQRHPN
jgi:hypothetical protein